MLDGVLKAVFLQLANAPHTVNELLGNLEISALIDHLSATEQQEYLNSIVNELLRKELIIQ